jgi:hypothetical protein
MRVPQVSERIKEAPAQALRGVFAGIGQLLLVTDKLRNKAPAGRDVPRARTPGAAGTVTDTTVTSPAAKTTRAADAETSRAANGATAGADSTAADAGAATVEASAAGTSAAAVAEPADEAPNPPKPQSTRDFDKTGNVRLLSSPALDAAAPTTVPEPTTASAPEPVSVPADTAPPLPNYDQLSVPSLRARLRNLDVTQVRQLADYERAHAARADVLTMFERRVAKLEAQA